MAHLTKRKKSGNYYVRYKDNLGRDQWISTRSKKLGGETGANAFFEDWLKNKKKYNTSNIMLSELITEVLKFIKLNLPRSYETYRECLNKFLNITNDKAVKLVNNYDIENYKNIRASTVSQRNKLISPYTINKEVRTVKSAFNKAVEELRLINENNLAKAAQIKVPKSKKRRRFTLVEKNMIFDNIKNPALFRISTIARYTGMRLSEVLSLQIKDVDLIKNRILISNKPDIGFYTKTGEERKINISDKLFEYFRTWLNIETESNNVYTLINPNQFVTFYEENKRYSKNYISRKFKTVLRKLNIEGYFHCLRHTFASELIESGVDIETLRDLLGHTNIKTTSIYLQSLNENKQKAVQKAI